MRASRFRSLPGTNTPAHVVISETWMKMRGARGQGHPISLTTAEEQFIRYETQSRSEYFHLASDPGEQHPLTDDARAVALDATLASNLGEHTTTAKSERVETIPPRLLEQLKALGYVQ